MTGTADDEAEGFCRATYPRLAGALGLQCGDPRIGEELAQEALLRLWQRWRTVEQPEAWAFRVGFNLASSRWRRVVAERRAYQRLDVRPPVTGPGPDAVAVRAAVAALPPRQRAAVVLRYFADLPVRDVAEALGCAEGTVKSLTSQGIATLRLHFDLEEHADA